MCRGTQSGHGSILQLAGLYNSFKVRTPYREEWSVWKAVHIKGYLNPAKTSN